MPVRRIVLAALPGLLLFSAQASAHAILVSSEPAAGASVPGGKIAMSLRYNSRIDRDRSRIVLVKPDHSQSVLPIGHEGTPDLLQTSVDLTVPGAYVVRWQVLATDGHITRGDVAFTVTGP